jgi:hypothetical protein
VLALFSLTVSILVTSSLAWFKVADTLIASNISIDFVHDEDFSIGLKKEGKTDYYKALDSATLQSYFSDFDPKKGLADVSSMYQSQWLNEKTVFADAKPVLRTGYSGSSGNTMTSAVNSGFLQFEFFIHSDRDMFVFLSETTTLLADTAADEKVAAALGVSPASLNKIQDCLRVSFYTDNGFFIYEPNVTTSSNTALAGRLNTSPRNSPYYDVDKDNKEVLFGDYNYDDPNLALVYDEASRAAVPSSDQLTGFVSGTNPAAQGGLDIAKSISEGNLSITHEKTYTLSELSNLDDTAHPLTYITGGVDQRMIVTVYIEGWDTDVVDSVGAGIFDLNLAFKGLYKSK